MHTKIKTFKSACKALGLDSAKIISEYAFSYFPVKEQAAMLAHAQLIIIVLAINGDWKPDWNDSNQYKYYPYFDMRKGFSFYFSGYDFTRSIVGSRLCFETREKAEYAGTQFEKLYKKYYLK